MKATIFERILQGIVSVWFIATATFLAMHLVPGDPLLSEKATTPVIYADTVIIPTHERGKVYVENPQLKGVIRRMIGTNPDYSRAWVIAEEKPL